MQVSWIDADHIKGLVEQIAPQAGPLDNESLAVEIDTVPAAAQDPGGESWGFAAGWMEPASILSPNVEEPSKLVDKLEEPEDEPEEGLHNSAAALPLSRIRDKLRAIRQRATEAGILTRVAETPAGDNRSVATSTASDGGATSAGDAATSHVAIEDEAVSATPATTTMPAPPPARWPVFEVAQGSREDRLAAFAGWARQVLAEDGGHLLVMNDDGEVLWGGDAKAGLVLSTMMAWGAAIRASAVSACDTPAVIRQPLASGNVLTVIPCDTRDGMIHAAVAAPAGLSDDLAHALREALGVAMR